MAGLWLTAFSSPSSENAYLCGTKYSRRMRSSPIGGLRALRVVRGSSARSKRDHGTTRSISPRNSSRLIIRFLPWSCAFAKLIRRIRIALSLRSSANMTSIHHCVYKLSQISAFFGCPGANCSSAAINADQDTRVRSRRICMMLLNK